jgi:transcriptional regulator with XRE-family HTH domain
MCAFNGKTTLTFGEWVTAERTRLGLKTAELGQLAGVSRVTVENIEKGRKGFRRDTVNALANALAGPTATDEEREAKQREARLAAAGAIEDFPEIERVPDEDDVFQTLAAYNGGDPGIKSLQQLAEIIKSAKTLTPDMKEEELSGLN